MKRVTSEESKSIILDILNNVAEFCDENSIRYYLTYGTLLGAIRHKGFIPWDDDIDIAMPRPDYDRFVDLYGAKGDYKISAPLVDKDCAWQWVKVYDGRTVKYEEGVDYNYISPRGVDIDVFPIDGVPDDYDEFINHGKKLISSHIYFNKVISPYNGSIIKRLFRLILRIIGRDYFMRKNIQEAMKYEYSSSEMIGHLPHLEPYLKRCPRSLFDSRVEVEFEGNNYWAPAGYDLFLKELYGDYMQLPPIEKRVASHEQEIYWIN